jgi:hypothetical protein
LLEKTDYHLKKQSNIALCAIIAEAKSDSASNTATNAAKIIQPVSIIPVLEATCAKSAPMAV